MRKLWSFSPKPPRYKVFVTGDISPSGKEILLSASTLRKGARNVFWLTPEGEVVRQERLDPYPEHACYLPNGEVRLFCYEGPIRGPQTLRVLDDDLNEVWSFKPAEKQIFRMIITSKWDHILLSARMGPEGPGTLYCLNADGEVIWTFSREDVIKVPAFSYAASFFPYHLARSPNGRYVAASFWDILYLLKDGELLWGKEMGGLVRGISLTNDGDVLVGTDFGAFLYSEDGERIWSFLGLKREDERGSSFEYGRVSISPNGRYLVVARCSEKYGHAPGARSWLYLFHREISRKRTLFGRKVVSKVRPLIRADVIDYMNLMVHVSQDPDAIFTYDDLNRFQVHSLDWELLFEDKEMGDFPTRMVMRRGMLAYFSRGLHFYLVEGCGDAEVEYAHW